MQYIFLSNKITALEEGRKAISKLLFWEKFSIGTFWMSIIMYSFWFVLYISLLELFIKLQWMIWRVIQFMA